MKALRALVVSANVPSDPLLKLSLALLDWKSETVKDAEAIQRLKSRHFDVVICEYNLSKGNALSLLCSIREMEIQTPAILIVVDRTIARLAPRELLGICAILVKPFTASELADALRRI
jgi:DNA-binding NtrC family response regulator